MQRDSSKRSLDDEDDDVSDDTCELKGEAAAQAEASSKRTKTEESESSTDVKAVDLNLPLPDEGGIACHVKVCGFKLPILFCSPQVEV